MLLFTSICSSIDAAADAGSECLAKLTAERTKQIQDACWKDAESTGGVISDNSAVTMNAESCEKEGVKNLQLTDPEMTSCFNQAPRVDDLPMVTTKFSVPPASNGAKVPTPKARPTVASKTPPAKTTAPTKTATAPKKATPSLSSATTTPENADLAQSHADQDINACLTSKSQAVQCCNNPLSCASSLSANDQQSLAALAQQSSTGPKPGQSISDYCSQMQQASASGGDVNSGLASVCYSNQSTCTSTCSQLVQKYQALVENCGDCEASYVYTNALSSMSGASSTCSSLKANATAMAQQGYGSASGQGYGSVCAQNASMNPQGSDFGSSPANLAAANNNPADPYGCSVNPGSAVCQNCSANPNSATCKAIAAAQANATGKASYTTASKKEDNSGFNTGSLEDAAATMAKMNLATNNAPANAAANQAAIVPNNSGGGIPGANNSPAVAGAASAKPAAVAAAVGNPVTDIMQGNRSGGYSQGSGFESFNRPQPLRALASAAKPMAAYLGMDLKRYLPGGSLDPQHIAGIGTASVEINGKGVDLFKKISNKIEEKCKLGILWECKP
ncbi:MAG: hypothetical protein ACXWQE_06185 [Bdellovibrionales bacterium]